LGIKADGSNLWDLIVSLFSELPSTNIPTLVIGSFATGFLFWSRKYLKSYLLNKGIGHALAEILAKAGPVLAIALTTLAAWGLDLQQHGVQLVGAIPSGLPSLTLPQFEYNIWQELLVSAVLISIVGFVESVSVAQTLAAKRRQRISPNQELIGLGASNIAASISGGFPVTGGFSRSVVNFDAGAETPAAGAFTAIGIALAALTLTPLLFFLPKATLAATIIVAVLSLVDMGALKRTWNFSRSDFFAMLATILLTLAEGVELGIIAGVGLSILLHLYCTSKPHSAIVGRVPGTEHFRNIDRHHVETDNHILTLRVDESLYFANARYLEDRVYDLVMSNPNIEHLILMCPAVNFIDASALESLEAINHRLNDSGVTLNLSEVKGPIMDRLRRTHFVDELTGHIFLSQYEAWNTLRSERVARSVGDL